MSATLPLLSRTPSRCVQERLYVYLHGLHSVGNQNYRPSVYWYHLKHVLSSDSNPDPDVPVFLPQCLEGEGYGVCLLQTRGVSLSNLAP